MIKNINQKHLFYFWVVAKQGSILKASAFLNVSQSAISEQIKVLEESLGLGLLLRGKTGVSVTEQGRLLFQVLDEFFPRIEELLEKLVNGKASELSFLKIGLSPDISNEVRFLFCHPFIQSSNFSVKVQSGENSFLQKAFELGELDLLLSTNSTLLQNWSKTIWELGEKEIMFVVRQSFWQRIERIGGDFTGEKFLNYTPDNQLHFHVSEYLKLKGMKMTRLAEVDEIPLIKSLVLSMDCLAALPYRSVQSELESGLLHKVGRLPEEWQPKLFAYCRKNLDDESFMVCLSKAVEDLRRLL